MTKVLFRVDAGRVPGLSFGHAFRCMALAQRLRDRHGAEVGFLMGDNPDGVRVVRDRGFQIESTARDADIEAAKIEEMGADLVVLDLPEPAAWPLARIRDGRAVAVLDDTGGKRLDADLVVNGSVVPEFRRYPFRHPGTEYLLGPEFCVLGNDFDAARPRAHARTMDRLLVTLGGSDPAGLTAPVVRALAQSSPSIRADIVLGPGFVGAEEIRAIAATADAQTMVHEAVPSLAEMMRRADLAIAAGGRTAYELAATGTPAILVSSHPAEAPVVRAFERLGTCLAMPDADADTDPGAMAAYLQTAMNSLSADVARRTRMSRMGQAAVDGRGCDRVATALAELLNRRDANRLGDAVRGIGNEPGRAARP